MFFYFSVPNLDPLLCMSRTCNSESFHSEGRILHEVNKYTQVVAQKNQQILKDAHRKTFMISFDRNTLMAE